MDLGVFYEVIVPLMEVEGTATICISTPLGSFNFYSELTEVRDDKGERVFNVRHIKGGRPPSWKPPEARSRVQAIYGSRSTLYRREIMGEIADEGENMAFDVQKLKRFFDKPPLKPPYGINENYVFIAMDPNGGASASDAPGSDTAIVSFVVSQGRVVVSSFVCLFLLQLGFSCRQLQVVGDQLWCCRVLVLQVAAYALLDVALCVGVGVRVVRRVGQL